MHMWLRWAFVTVSLAACSRGPGPRLPADAALPDALAGCYALHRTQELYYAPPQLRLSADSLAGWSRRFVEDSMPTARTVTRLDTDGRTMDEHDHSVLYWQVDRASARVRVLLSSGHSGTELSLDASASADTLRGHATEHWDFGPPFTNPGGRVALIRISCLTDSLST